MKKYLLIILLVAGVLFSIKGIYGKYQFYKDSFERASNNIRAYEAEYSALEEKNRQFSLTIDELLSSKDSINQKLIEVSERLKIKNKNLKELQYHSSIISKVDTVIFRDTIFKKEVNIDTIIGDQWYNVDMKLKYPSSIVLKPTFKSNKYVVISTKKEYNKKPSKIFFIRWFQKKHTEVIVDIVEENPYIENKESRFIQIVNK